MLKLTKKEINEMCNENCCEWAYVNDEMTDAYNNGERGLIKSRFDFYTNATVFGKKFTSKDYATDADAKEDSSYVYSNGIKETNYLDKWTGYFYSLFEKDGEDVLLKSDVFMVGKMYAYDNFECTGNAREILIPLTKEVGEGDDKWVLFEEIVEKAIKEADSNINVNFKGG